MIDADRVVAFPSLSLAAGAVKGWDRRNAYTHSLLESVAQHYGFDIETPFEQLAPKARQVLLHGSGSEEIEFVYQAEGGEGRVRAQVKRCHPFEGILPNFERRWRETDSVAVREELARYQAAKPCPECGGARLRREARHVFLQHRHRATRASRSTRSSTPRWPSAWPISRTSSSSAPRPRSPTRSCARSARGCTSSTTSA